MIWSTITGIFLVRYGVPLQRGLAGGSGDKVIFVTWLFCGSWSMKSCSVNHECKCTPWISEYRESNVFVLSFHTKLNGYFINSDVLWDWGLSVLNRGISLLTLYSLRQGISLGLFKKCGKNILKHENYFLTDSATRWEFKLGSGSTGLHNKENSAFNTMQVIVWVIQQTICGVPLPS